MGARRGQVVVCVAAGGRLEDFVESVRRVLAHSPSDVGVLVHGGGAPVATPSVLDRMEGADRLAVLQAESGRVTLADAAAAAAPADVVAMGFGSMIAAGWLERLTEAAIADAEVATASALSAGLIAPGAGDQPAEWLDGAAPRVAAAAVRNRPRLLAPHGGCVYLRRSALELGGAHDLPDLDAFGARCLQHGLCHVLADDVLVLERGAASSVPDESRSADGPVGRAHGTARRALRGLSVLIDARSLDGPLNGTRRQVTELIGAVARTGEASVIALVPDGLDAATRASLERIDGLTLVAASHAGRSPAAARADVVHRPHQIGAPADLAVLAGLADRLVVTHQDLISFHNPGYFASSPAWEGYRDLTRRALAAADRVVFFSAHARSDALAEELVDASRADVVHLGVDHAVAASSPERSRPAGAESLDGETELMLCLGSDFAHKNRVFALEILGELQRRHRWPGRLVLAGPHVRYGSSRDQERALLAQDSRLADAVVRLGEVSEAEKAWLLGRSTLILYPTVHEGFGLIPFEAAAAGVPCLWAAGTALRELLGDTAAQIVVWDAAATADQALALMRDAPARSANLSVIEAAASALRWDVTGRRLVDVYRAACDGPMTPAGALERSSGLMRGGLSEDAMRLVGPHGVLPAELERPLLALLTRRRLAGPLSAALKAGYRASRWQR
jgi:glycosyltransferase involved in cell wall biosynthesis